MTMRAEVQRDSVVTTDAYGHADAPVWAAHATIACWLWSKQRREILDGNKEAIVEDLRVMFPFGADVTEADRILNIRDRLGAITLAGPFRIETLQSKRDHIEAAIKRVD